MEFGKVVKSLIRRGRTYGRLFEIGCAYGFFLLEARKYFDVHGIEVPPMPPRIATKALMSTQEWSVTSAWRNAGH
jgi:hypothetical protein